MILSFSLTAFAVEEINDFTCPASPTNGNGSVPVAIGIELGYVAIGNERITDTDYIGSEGVRLQRALYDELNKVPNGTLKAIPLEAQGKWAQAGELAKRKNPNRDASKVMYGGGKTPQYIVEITKFTKGNADNDTFISDLSAVILNNYYSNIPLDAGLANQLTVVRLEARIYDLRTKENVEGSDNGMILAVGKGEANNAQVVVSVFGSNRNKNTNDILSEDAAIRNLAVDIQKKAKGIPLHRS